MHGSVRREFNSFTRVASLEDFRAISVDSTVSDNLESELLESFARGLNSLLKSFKLRVGKSPRAGGRHGEREVR